MCNVNLLLQMSYSLKIEEISMKITEVEACMTVSQRMINKPILTYQHKTTAASNTITAAAESAAHFRSGSRRTLHATHQC